MENNDDDPETIEEQKKIVDALYKKEKQEREKYLKEIEEERKKAIEESKGKISGSVNEKAFMIDRKREQIAAMKELHPDILTPAKQIRPLVEEKAFARERQKEFDEQRVRIGLGQKRLEMYPIEDLFWQATTRGGRQVDKILKGQVVFRQTNERLGTALTEVSENAMIAAPLFKEDADDVRGAAAALGLVGVAQMAIAANVRPRADTRYWDNLPDAIHIYAFRSESRLRSFTASFLASSGHEVIGLKSQFEMHYAGGYGLGWVRSRSALVPGQ